MARPRGHFPAKLNYLSAAWFWLTISGVFYCGLGYVLPVIYAGHTQAFFWCHHLFCYFLFLEMTVNWVLVKLVSSPFKPEAYLDYLSAHAEEIANGGYEINLNHLKGNDEGSYSIAASNLKPLGGQQQKANLTGTMYVVEVEGRQNSLSRKVVYPYWSWKPCVICQCQRPPRAHHCPVCNTCVLKRDHHCFFTGSCVGLNNQRFFVVFAFWASVATVYCIFHSTLYLFSEYLPRNSYLDLFLPFALLRWLFGYLSALDAIMAMLLYSLVWFWLTTTGFVIEQFRLIRKGKTSFEEDSDIKVTSMGSTSEHVRAVFGEHWWLNFIVPMHKVYPSTEDGVTWPHIKT